MITLAIENVNGSPILVVKGERSEVYPVAPDHQDSKPSSARRVMMSRGWGVVLYVGIHLTKDAPQPFGPLRPGEAQAMEPGPVKAGTDDAGHLRIHKRLGLSWLNRSIQVWDLSLPPSCGETGTSR
jgi:hypothetical protein